MRCKWINIFGIKPAYNNLLHSGNFECRLKFYGTPEIRMRLIKAALKKHGFDPSDWKFVKVSPPEGWRPEYLNVYVPHAIAAQLAAKAETLTPPKPAKPAKVTAHLSNFTLKELKAVRSSLAKDWNAKPGLIRKVKKMIDNFYG